MLPGTSNETMGHDLGFAQSPPVTDAPALSRDLRSQDPAAPAICPRLLPQVEAWPLFLRRDPRKDVYIIGNRDVDRYVSVPAPALPLVRKALALFDGAHSLESVQARLLAEDRKRVDVRRLYQQLYANGLLASPAPVKVKQGDIDRMSLKLFVLPVQNVFRALRFLGGAIFPWLAAALLLLMITGAHQALAHREMWLASSQSPWGDSGRAAGLLLYPVLLLLSFCFHEIAHGVVASRYGIVARRFEAALYLGLIPIIYLRIPGLYTLRPIDRIKVWSAGIYWNLAFASFSVLWLRWAAPAPPWNQIWLMIAVANCFLAATNLFPFLPTDGYFILCTLLKTYNVRSKAWKEFRGWIASGGRRFSAIPVIYFVCTVAVTALILGRDLLWLYRIHGHGGWNFKIAFALLVVPLLLLVWRWVWAGIRMPRVRSPNSSMQESLTV